MEMQRWQTEPGEATQYSRRRCELQLPKWSAAICDVVGSRFGARFNPVIYDAMMWAMYSGIRKSEILRLKFTDFELKNGSYTIRVFKNDIEGGKEVMLPLNDDHIAGRVEDDEIVPALSTMPAYRKCTPSLLARASCGGLSMVLGMIRNIRSVRVAKSLLTATGVLLLAACSGTGSTPVTDPFATLSSAYAPASVWYASRRGMRTVLHGNPFSSTRAEFEQAILSGLRLPAWHQKAEFISYPVDGKRRGHRLVLVFNPTGRISHGDACDDLSEIGVGAADSMTRLHVAFCTSERSLSEISGRVFARNLDDPALTKLLAQAIDQLLPPSNFENAGTCKIPGRC